MGDIALKYSATGINYNRLWFGFTMAITMQAMAFSSQSARRQLRGEKPTTAEKPIKCIVLK